MNSASIFPAIAMPKLWTPATNFTLELAEVLLIIIGVVAVILFIVSLLKKDKHEALFVELDNDGFIEAVLLRAAETQIHFDIICTRSGIEHRHLLGYCRASDNQDLSNHKPFDELDTLPNLVLDIHEGGIAEGWDNAPIDIYFQINHNQTSTLYHFASFVTKIRNKGSRTLLEIIRPSILSDSKAKDTVRIEPKPEMIALAYAWFYYTEDLVLPTSIKKLGKNHASYRPQGNSDFRVVSITSSTIRMRFLKDLLDEMEHTLKRKHQLCLLLAINTNNENDKKMLLWLKCTCIGFAPCLDPECLDAIFSFTHWEQISQRKDEIKWNPASDTDRVPPLMHWIMNADINQKSA